MRGEMRLRAGLLGIGIALAVAAGSAAGPADATSRATGDRLRAFAGCPSFLAYVRDRALPLVGPYGITSAVGIGALTPPPMARDAVAGAKAGQEFAQTNVQEEGVDEPDMVKTDGRTMFVVSGGRLSSVDVRGRRPRLLDSLRLETGAAHELLLHGNRLLVLSQAATAMPVDGIGIRAPWPYPAVSNVALVDVRDPARMRVERVMELDGGYLTARLVGRTARIVVSSPIITDLPFVQPDGTTPDAVARAKARNRDVVRKAPVGRWLPAYRIRGAGGAVRDEGSLVQCRNIRRPQSFSGMGLLTVLTVDVERGLDPVDSDAVVSDGRIVYASHSSLYVATERWDPRLGRERPLPGDVRTAIHRFDISSPSATHYRASGSVPGLLLGQWSLSERSGILRVASTEQPLWWGGPRIESETLVTTLGERSGALVELGRVGGLGKGERVYAVRFVGDLGYVVTFRQVDPLYVVDLSSPARPAVRGELKIRGYSAYLHPVGDDLLLGIGQDATGEGRALGTQASLFDVSDARRPVRLDAYALGKAWSEAEVNHHAFLWWPASRLAVIPIQAAGEETFAGALALRVRRAGIAPAARIAHGGSTGPGEPVFAVRRSVVVGDVLYTVTDASVKASSLASFADLGIARLPVG